MFVLLTGTASTALLHRRRAVGQAGGQVLGRLRFELDDHRRWSLWYYGDAQPVALLRDAEVVAWVGDQPVTLAELEDSTVGNRRPPGGTAVVVRGRAAGVWVEAEFLAGETAGAPQAAITVTIFPDRYLPTVKGVRFFRVPAAAVLQGTGPLVALVNGYQSRDACRLVAVGTPEAQDLASHGALGLTRGDRGLGLAFDAGEPGEARVQLSRDGLEGVSDWLPTRPLRPAGDASRLRIGYAPDGDGLDALRAVFAPSSPLDQERLAQAVAPAGWCASSGSGGEPVTEADVVANAEFCAAHFDRRFFRYIQLDDGYQKAAGDWETNERFPSGHRALTDKIHASGFKAGLWMAPFAVAERSGVPAAHPDWLLRDAAGGAGGAGGLIAWGTREAWGGKLYALDGAHPKVQQWLTDLARKVVRDWGYDCLEIDALHCATTGPAHYGGLTHAEAYRAGLTALRDGLGTEAFLLAGGAPLQHAAGLVNGMRIGPDASPSWAGLQIAARAAAHRSFYQRASWLNDPDRLPVRPPLSASEAHVWASLVALSGGLTLFSDDLPKLAPERAALLQRVLPVAPVAGRPVAGTAVERDVAPALVSGDDVYSIPGPWHFRTGDDGGYGAREFDEESWETIAVPQRWAEAGHPEYSGVAWYRTRFQLPNKGDGTTEGRKVYLDLGKIADADETYLNGGKIGRSDDGQAYRRYRVPAELLNWGGENVLAVRVSASRGGGGGIWSTRRDRPPVAWVAEGASRWWTVVLVNWEDDPRDVAVPLAALGISGARFAAYDVWRDAPLADPKDSLAATLEPRSALVVAVRPAAARPQVIGTTRHVVQGAVDVVDETWDAATRTLAAKAVNLDGRAYAVTIAVPKGMRPGACKANVPCTVKRLESGQAVIEWAAGDGRDIRWELSFRSATGSRKGKD